MTTSSLGTPFLQDAPYPGPAAVRRGYFLEQSLLGTCSCPSGEGADFTLYRGRSTATHRLSW